jgi:hypothetical protein
MSGIFGRPLGLPDLPFLNGFAPSGVWPGLNGITVLFLFNIYNVRRLAFVSYLLLTYRKTLRRVGEV